MSTLRRFSFLAFAGFIGLTCLAFPKDSYAIYDKNYIGETVEYSAVFEDTFIHLARKNGLGFVEMRAANPKIDPWIPGEGTKLIIPSRHLLPDVKREGIVINLPEMRVYAFVNGDKAPSTYPIGIGREGLSTPTGKTEIVRKKDGPTWRPTPRMRKEDPELPESVPPGPDNPLGTHALYLGWPAYLIHGTNRPYGIGRRVSSGCIRLYPENIKMLFKEIEVGTEVNVINQPVKVAWIENELYLEVHPDLEQAILMEETGQVKHRDISDEDMKRITSAAGEFQDRLRWPTIRAAFRERKGYPLLIARVPKSFIDRINPFSSSSSSFDHEEASSTKGRSGGVVVPDQKPSYQKSHTIELSDTVPLPPALPSGKRPIVARVD